MRVLNVLQRAGSMALMTLGVAASGSCHGPSGVADAGTMGRIEPPVPAPDGLLMEASVRAPDAAWARIQRGVSGVATLLPPTVGELVCSLAGLDARLAQLVDGQGTAFVVLAGEGTEAGRPTAGAQALRWAMALPLTDAPRASSVLFGAEDADGGRGGSPAPHTAHDVAGMRALSATGAPRNVAAALAVGARGWLVLASSDDDLASLGAYAVRTLPTRAIPSEPAAIVAEVPQSALAGALSSWLGARWAETRAWLGAKDDEERASHGGRAPDFGDPQPIIEAVDGAVRRRLTLLAQARGARIIVDAGDDEVHAELTVEPGSDAVRAGQLAALVAGDARPLAACPADAILAVMGRDDPEDRDQDAAAIEGTLDRALGERLREDDSRAVHTALDDWMHARGDWWTAAVGWGTSDASHGLWLATPAASADASSHAIRELVDLSHRQVFQALLAGALHVSPAVVTRFEAAPLGNASLATFAENTAGGRPPSPAAALGLAWAVAPDPVPGELLVAGGPAARQLLSMEAAPPGRVGDDPRSARALAALGDTATFALFAQPLRLDPDRAGSPGADSAPVAIAWGRKGARGWARIEVADAVLGELLRLRGDP